MSTEAAISAAATHRKTLWACLLLLTLWAGIRFSDGTVLVAISRGLPPSDPSLNNMRQWLWDAPLKVGLLKLLPANVISIGLAFALLAVLPALGLISLVAGFRWLTLVTVFLTPAFKISVQNVGVGDGAILFLELCICATKNIHLLAVAGFAMALWHRQQAFFVGMSFFIGRFGYGQAIERRQAVAIAGSLVTGALVTRVMTITSLPIVLSGAQLLVEEGHVPPISRLVVIGAIVALIPPLNWSGLDWLLWPDLIHDLCKWHLVCLRGFTSV